MKKLLIVDNCCVCASSKQKHIVALIVPNTKEISVNLSFKVSNEYRYLFSLQRYVQKHYNEEDWKKLVDNEDFNDDILRKVQDTCKNDGIKNFETPKYIKIVTEQWSPESGLVNDALKLKRKAIDEKYKDDIKQLYEGKLNKDNKKHQ